MARCEHIHLVTMSKIETAIARIDFTHLAVTTDVALLANLTMEQTELTPEEISWYVVGHGTFTATVSDYLKARALTRKALIARLLRIYEGCSAHGDKGDKASHWRGYDKRDLALIVADCYGA